MTGLTPDEARILPRYRRQALEQEAAANVQRAIEESRDDDPHEPRKHEKTKDGDPWLLRGVPLNARGTAPGTVTDSVTPGSDAHLKRMMSKLDREADLS